MHRSLLGFIATSACLAFLSVSSGASAEAQKPTHAKGAKWTLVRLGKPGQEVWAAKATLAQLGRVRSVPELLEAYSNETALLYGDTMLGPLSLASSGIGVSTAHIARPDETLKRELAGLLKRYGIEESFSPDEYVKALERAAPEGRKFALDLYQLSARTRQRHKVKGADPYMEMFKPPALKPDAFDYAVVSPIAVKVTLRNTKGRTQSFDVRVEEGAWRIHDGGIKQIRARYGDQKKQGTDKP